ncbi:MAG: hypothetical protein K2K14_08355 [Ruminococcus sp.]|nr:hypothetical protein [Ruminococcus sp.]
MKKLKVYKVYMEDNREYCKSFSVIVPAWSKKEAIEYCHGNGDVVFVKDVTDCYKIDLETLAQTLTLRHYERADIEIITRTLELVGLSE